MALRIEAERVMKNDTDEWRRGTTVTTTTKYTNKYTHAKAKQAAKQMHERRTHIKRSR